MVLYMLFLIIMQKSKEIHKIKGDSYNSLPLEKYDDFS